MGQEELRVVEQILAALPSDDIVAGLGSEESDAKVGAALARCAEPDFEVRMLAPERVGGRAAVDHGADGFGRVWEEWTGAYESFQIEVERTIDAGDKIVHVVRLRGRTKTGGVEVEQSAAGVWTVRDGKLTRVDFYLEADEAMRAAGLDPQSLQE